LVDVLSLLVAVVSDPRSAAALSLLGPFLQSKLFVTVKSDIALSKSMYPLAESTVV
jgi:hypothetical protein